MKMPNGYGGIYKLQGNRRKPFVVRKSVIDAVTNKQIFKVICYCETRKLALQALAEYNRSPYDVDAAKISFSEVYDLWSETKFPKISDKNVLDYKASFKTATAIHTLKMSEIKVAHLQDVVDNSGKNFPTLRKLRTMFHQVYEYAMQNDIIDKDYSQYIDIGKNEKPSERKPFTDIEIKKLFDSVDRMEYIDTILILIYTGMRIGELLTIKSCDVHIADNYMRGGSKSEAGKDRVIPINHKIMPYIKKYFEQGRETLISMPTGEPMEYFHFREDIWRILMEQLGMEHKSHDCRHTFASLMDTAGANKLCIKRIMGHASKDVTDKVYTHKDIAELIAAVELI